MKFKVGDRVIIKDGSKIEDYVGGWGDGMEEHVGEICTIDEVRKLDGGKDACFMEEYSFAWDSRALEKVNETIAIYRKGQEVHALDKSTGEKAVAKCHTSDTFDFREGAKRAFKRLMETDAKMLFTPGMVIWCETRAEYDALMQQLETHGYKWIAGQSPKDYDGFHDGGITIFTYTDKTIAFSTGRINNVIAFRRVDFGEPLYDGKVVCADNNLNQGIYTVGKIYQFVDGYITGDNGQKYPQDPVHDFAEWEKWTSSKFIEVVE